MALVEEQEVIKDEGSPGECWPTAGEEAGKVGTRSSS